MIFKRQGMSGSFLRNAVCLAISVSGSACGTYDRHGFPSDWGPFSNTGGSALRLAGDYAYKGEAGNASGRTYELNMFARPAMWNVTKNATHVKIEDAPPGRPKGLVVRYMNGDVQLLAIPFSQNLDYWCGTEECTFRSPELPDIEARQFSLTTARDGALLQHVEYHYTTNILVTQVHDADYWIRWKPAQ